MRRQSHRAPANHHAARILPADRRQLQRADRRTRPGTARGKPELASMALVDDVSGIRRILLQSRTIAVVGLSGNWYRPSFFAAKYMQDHGYRIVPVNPSYDEVLGQKSYPTLRDMPHKVDIVDCFRKSDEIPPIARDAIEIGAKVLWMQLGIRNDQAAAIALDAGLDVVMNRCVRIEHGRILGGVNWAGVNTGIVSARRPG